MTYYMLPHTTKNMLKHIHCITDTEPPQHATSHTLSKFIASMKERITPVETKWDEYKKYTNPYEFIHTPIPTRHRSVARYKPLSRSYFKMIELIHLFELLDVTGPIRTFHLAEGPGGFIEAVARVRDNSNDQYIGMTIQDDDNSVPGWKRTYQVLKRYPNIHIENGASGTGDILDPDNFAYINDTYRHTMHLITGDGGFDFSENFNHQEHDIIRLLYGQVCYALVMQKHGGHFVLKMFDCFYQHTVDILYILSAFYQKVYICKPHTSRYANSEKYIICRGYIQHDDVNVYALLRQSFIEAVRQDRHIHRLVRVPISAFFNTKVQEYNAVLGQQQLENIMLTLNLITQDLCESEKRNNHAVRCNSNVLRCVQWCNKYNIEINASVITEAMTVVH